MVQEYKQRPRDEALEKIECYIAKEKLKPHDRLPGERDMCGMWGLNRTTLRAAIGRLISEGKLYNRKGAGTYVAVPKLKERLQDLRSFSQMVREEGRLPATEIVSMDQIESTKQIAKKLKVTIGHPVWQLVRLRSIDGVPAMLETVYMSRELFPDMNQYVETRSLYEVMEHVYHEAPWRGSEKISLTYATKRESELLLIETGMPLFYISGTVESAGGIVTEYFKNVARPDRIQFTGELKDDRN